MNAALVIALTIAGLASFGWAIRLTMRGPKFTAIPAAYLGLVAFTWVAMASRTGGYRPENSPDGSAATRPTEESMDDYVTSDTCRSCHPAEHHSWHASYHRTMTQVATKESVKGDFDSGYIGEFPGMSVRFSREAGDFWATYAFTRPGGGYRAVEKRRIVMTTGSHHYQVYWTGQPWSGDERPGDRAVWLVPSVYLFDEEQWVPRQASFLLPPSEAAQTHVWNTSCLRCHTTHGIQRVDPADQSHDSRTVELGISCEACHGPGRAHVDANRDLLRRYRLHRNGEGDPTIVNPARLGKHRSADTCGQCHSVNIPPDRESAERLRQEGKPYRPGQDLNASTLVVHPGRDDTAIYQKTFPDFFSERFWPDGMVRVAGREYHGLLESACFQRGEMSCLSCHGMHRDPGDPRSDLEWADDQLHPTMRENRACTQCHTEFADLLALSEHTHHSAESSGSNCYNCHMPHTSYGLLKGVRSHQIDSPSVAVDLETGRPNACNLCHLDRTLGWTAGKLEAWHGLPPPPLDKDQETIAAGLLWLLTGDAGQRALAASAMGRKEPREISGTDWMPPFLGQLHEDPYPAVRIIASKALRSIEGYGSLPRYPESESAVGPANDIWENRTDPRRTDASLLLNGDGTIRRDEVQRLLNRRDDRPVRLKE